MKIYMSPMHEKESDLHYRDRRAYRQKILTKLGFDANDISKWRCKWMTTFKRATRKFIDYDLTFEDYMRLAKKARITSYDQIGRSITSYHLSRIGDTGGYTIENCRFITNAKNQQEKIINGGAAYGGYVSSRTYRVRNPDGVLIRGKNIADLCRVHNLSPSKMSLVCLGKRKHHKHWTGWYTD